MNKTGTSRKFFAGLLCMALLIGCGTGDKVADDVAKANKNNVSKVASCYNLFLMKNGFKGPKNKEELVKMIMDPSVAGNMEMIGVDTSDVDAIFISERDGEEIKIRWGVKGSSLGTNEPVAFESTGKNGVRLVCFATGVLQEVEDDQTYNDMLAGKYKPPSTRDATPKFDKDGNKIN
jgi:hypothetical protein